MSTIDRKNFFLRPPRTVLFAFVSLKSNFFGGFFFFWFYGNKGKKVKTTRFVRFCYSLTFLKMALLACSPLGSSAMLKISAAAFFYPLLPFHASYSFCFKRCWALCQITVLTLVHSQILIELDFRTLYFFQAMRCEIRRKRAMAACHAWHAF